MKSLTLTIKARNTCDESYEVLVLTDEMILIGNAQKHDKNAFRRNQVLGLDGKELYLIMNCYALSADEVAKWMKQHLNIKKFYGVSEQAVHNRVNIAMIITV